MTVEPRLENPPVMQVPGAMQAMQSLHGAIAETAVPHTTLDLVALRTSQLNGCSFCVHMHARDLRQAGESDERIDTVSAWRESPWFTDAERAALALTDALTVITGPGEVVPDEVWDEAAGHYGEVELSALLLQIAATGVWNRLNA